MFLPDKYENYSYTKIEVPLVLKKSPSDYEDIRYYLDVNEDNYFQENCYIGLNKINEVSFKRINKADCEKGTLAKWQLEMIINGGKSEEEVIAILNQLCTILSFKFAKYYRQFQYCGFEGFSYERMNIQRKYAYKDEVFSSEAFSMYCDLEASEVSVIENKIFNLPRNPVSKDLNMNYQKLKIAFLRALKCKDKISRYILLYYLFEIMYETSEYKLLKENYKPISDKEDRNDKRSIILYQYLQQEFNLNEYSSYGEKFLLKADILKEIILARNDLTHRGDSTKISELMYKHMLPILQKVVRKL